MNTQVTLTLPDELYEHAKRWATIAERDLSEILTDALIIVLTPVYTAPRLEKPISSLSDEEVLALSKAQRNLVIHQPGNLRKGELQDNTEMLGHRCGGLHWLASG